MIVRLEDYKVVVGADKQIIIPGSPGELKVWIGSSKFTPNFDIEKNVVEKSIPSMSDTAKITPFTPGIDTEPKESFCEKIDPTGSEVRFQLKPLSVGIFKVGADVALYESADCSGIPIPKTSETIQVEVNVSPMSEIHHNESEIVSNTIKKLMVYWDKFIGLFLALIFFLVGKKLFKWFGFKSNE